jgi:hypothetical protein
VYPYMQAAARDASRALWITEGIKKGRLHHESRQVHHLMLLVFGTGSVTASP